MLIVMFDIGFGEMVLLAAIALIAIGPKQLPEVARTVGKLLGELKKAMGDITSTVANAREETDKAIRKVTSDLTDISEGINKDVSHGLNVDPTSNTGVAVAPDAVPKREYVPNPIVDLPPHEGCGAYVDPYAEVETPAVTTATQVTATTTTTTKPGDGESK